MRLRVGDSVTARVRGGVRDRFGARVRGGFRVKARALVLVWFGFGFACR